MTSAVEPTKMTEADVLRRFVGWLEGQGWTLDTPQAFEDVRASRNGVTLVAEAKGHTAAPGLDVDTMYGQILRSMTDPSEQQHAVVVPVSLASKALRVSAHVRAALNVTIYVVHDDGSVSVASEQEA